MENENNFDKNLNNTINKVRKEIGESKDLIIREFEARMKDDVIRLAIIFNSGLVEKVKLDNLSIELNALINLKNYDYIKEEHHTLKLKKEDQKNALESFYNSMKTSLLCNSKIFEGFDDNTLYDQILTGNTVILLDGFYKFLILNTYGPKGRDITEPTSQTVIKGPKDSFTENIETNISQIRRRIKDKSLKIENMAIGNITKTSIALVYINTIAKDSIVNDMRYRLTKINVDAILDSGYLEEYLKSDINSIFPTLISSERPDAIVGGLLEGKVAIVVDGSPYVLAAPGLFIDFLQVSEDYNQHYFIASATRVLRIISFFLTLLIPSVYIALTTFHQEMLPTSLLISIAAQREGVPFPSFVEALLMELIFDILKEASIRLPRAIGPAISIVGALVLGQAAVQAGIISAVIVIIVSITAITSFAIPYYAMSNAVRILRFGLMVLAATFGLYGIYIGLIILTFHLCKLKSVGVPYLTPTAPYIAGNNKDTIVRYPLWRLKYRPSATSKSKTPRNDIEKTVASEKKDNQELT